MRNLRRNSSFHLAFGWSMISFLITNLIIHVYAKYRFENPPSSEIRFSHLGGFESGFPFTMYVFGFRGYLFAENWIWSGLIGNFLVAIVASFAMGALWVWRSSIVTRV